ncbi:MAG: hypothetical protein IPL32_19815 [Chloracidobacterium sp.]|nr:hypothetical protein [Chloracidobacterium sp.]
MMPGQGSLSISICLPVLTFWQDAGGAICKCQRLERSGEVGYNTRPIASCDWAYSDEVQGFYDDIAVQARNDKFRNTDSGSSGEPANVTEFYNQTAAITNSLIASYGAENVIDLTCGQYMPGNLGPAGAGFSQANSFLALAYDANGNPQLGVVKFPSGYTCADFNSGRLSTGLANESIKRVQEHQSSQDTALMRLDEGINSIQKTLGNNNSSIMDELGKIRSKPTGGANLNPVLDAIQSMRESQSSQLNRIDSSFSAEIENLSSSFETTLREQFDSLISKLGNDTGSKSGTDVSGIEKRQDTTNIRLKSGFQNLGDSLSGMKKGIANLDSTMQKNSTLIYRMDSANQANRYFDRLEDSLAYEKVMDSLANKDSYKAQAEQGIQDAQGFAIQGETNATGLKTSLQGWQTLPGTCSDAPTWEIDLSSANLGKMEINLNQYPWVPAFSRVGMRVAGLMASLLIVLKAMELLGYSNAKKD